MAKKINVNNKIATDRPCGSKEVKNVSRNDNEIAV